MTTRVYVRQISWKHIIVCVCIVGKCTLVCWHETVQFKLVSNREYNTGLGVEYLMKQ